MDLPEQQVIALQQPRALEFPDGDGKPMGETGIHVRQILDLLAALILYFRPRPDVYAGANMFVYYDANDPGQNVAPDVFVALGVKPGERRSWKTWEEGKAPDVVFEITSKKTRNKDTDKKPEVYAGLGVREYYLFDPLNEYLRPQLQGYRRVGGVFQRVVGRVLTSEVLGLELRIKDDGRLHLFDPQRGEWLWTPAELGDRYEMLQARAEAERARAEAERTRAEAEQARAEAAESELARLRAELAKLKGE